MKGKQNAYSLRQNKKFVLDKGYSLDRAVQVVGSSFGKGGLLPGCIRGSGFGRAGSAQV